MEEEYKNVRQLLMNDNPENVSLALQILKGKPDLAERVKASFQPILDASKKKTLTRDERREQKKIALKKQRFKVRVHKGFKTMISGDSSSESDDEDDYNKKRTNNSNNNPHRQHNHHHHN